MGAEPGRRFLKQPGAKLEPVIAMEYLSRNYANALVIPN